MNGFENKLTRIVIIEKILLIKIHNTIENEEIFRVRQCFNEEEIITGQKKMSFISALDRYDISKYYITINDSKYRCTPDIPLYKSKCKLVNGRINK